MNTYSEARPNQYRSSSKVANKRADKIRSIRAKRERNQLKKQISKLNMCDPVDEYFHRKNSSEMELQLQDQVVLIDDGSYSISSIASDPTADLLEVNSEEFYASKNLKTREKVRASLNSSVPSSSFFSRWDSSCSDLNPPSSPVVTPKKFNPVSPVTRMVEEESDDNSISFFSVDIDDITSGRITATAAAKSKKKKASASSLLLSPMVMVSPVRAASGDSNDGYDWYASPQLKLGSQLKTKSPRAMPSMDCVFPKSPEGNTRPPMSPRRSQKQKYKASESAATPELKSVSRSPRQLPSLDLLFD